MNPHYEHWWRSSRVKIRTTKILQSIYTWSDIGKTRNSKHFHITVFNNVWYVERFYNFPCLDFTLSTLTDVSFKTSTWRAIIFRQKGACTNAKKWNYSRIKNFSYRQKKKSYTELLDISFCTSVCDLQSSSKLNMSLFTLIFHKEVFSLFNILWIRLHCSAH